jgi:hypothetical protein
MIHSGGVYIGVYSFTTPTLANALDSFALTKTLLKEVPTADSGRFLPPMELNIEVFLIDFVIIIEFHILFVEIGVR